MLDHTHIYLRYQIELHCKASLLSVQVPSSCFFPCVCEIYNPSTVTFWNCFACSFLVFVQKHLLVSLLLKLLCLTSPTCFQKKTLFWVQFVQFQQIQNVFQCCDNFLSFAYMSARLEQDSVTPLITNAVYDVRLSCHRWTDVHKSLKLHRNSPKKKKKRLKSRSKTVCLPKSEKIFARPSNLYLR